jgi:hypothetical protein
MRRLALLIPFALLVGCNDSRVPQNQAGKSPAPEAIPAVEGPNRVALKQGPGANVPGLGGAGPGGFGGGAGQGPAADKAATRKIIFTGHTDIIVTDFEGARKQVVALAEGSGGYVANFNIDATSGDRRRGTYVLRIPAARFQPTLDALAQLGHVTTTRTDSTDVTDEFYDLEARLKTKQEEEKALRELLAKSAGKLEDLLAVRRELKQIREEIESMQGRLNKLSKLTELTTVNVTLHEQKDYVPPTAPTFGGRIGTTFSDSTQALSEFLKGATLLVVAATPWLPLLVLAAVVLFLTRRLYRRTNGPAVAPPAAD